MAHCGKGVTTLVETIKRENFQISLASARVNAKMTQEEVAKALKISKLTIINWESNKTAPDIRVFRKLCDLYNISGDNIFLPN